MKTATQTTLPLHSLIPADYNPRTISDAEMKSLRASVKKWGVVSPLVLRAEDRLIIGGHQRAVAIRAELIESEGMTSEQADAFPVPVALVGGLTEDETKALNIALNRISGRFDYEKLSEILSEMDASLTELTGFGQKEIDDIVALTAAEATLPAMNEAELDATMAQHARRFSFEVKTDDEATLCTDILKRHGMTGPGDASVAFVKVCTAAKATVPA